MVFPSVNFQDPGAEVEAAKKQPSDQTAISTIIIIMPPSRQTRSGGQGLQRLQVQGVQALHVDEDEPRKALKVKAGKQASQGEKVGK
jgi:hypothetical protein